MCKSHLTHPLISSAPETWLGPFSTGAVQVITFGHRVRRGPAHWHNLDQNNITSRGPLHRAHVDQSYDGAVIRLREQFQDPGEAERVMTRRWQIINASSPASQSHYA